MRERLAPIWVSISGMTVLEGMAVVGVARQRLDVGDELPALRAGERGGARHLDAELVRAVRLALADALDLGRM
jgi:hypothetical protein